MARWTDLATWRGPTANCGDGDQYPNEGDDRMREHRGLVIHIAEGYFEGTISYQRNPDANVSSHFVLSNGVKGQGYDGELAQVVDTDITAWTQRAGNGHWLSVECAGFTPNPLTAAQCESVARLLARCHTAYGVPLQLAVNPDGRGLGHHSMGCNWPSGAWGHCDCPGPAIIAQKPAIVARAIEIAGGEDMTPQEQYLLRVMNVRIDAIKGLKTAVVMPSFTASDGSQFPGFAEPCQLGLWAAGQTASDEELKVLVRQTLQEVSDDQAVPVSLTPEQIEQMTAGVVAGVATAIDVPTAQENAEAVLDTEAARLAQ
jgi:hypothetical protein